MTTNALTALLGIEWPIIQAPMAGANDAAMAARVSAAGGLGSLPCAMLDGARIRSEVGAIRAHTARPFNLNFFCHRPCQPGVEQLRRWRQRLEPYYREFGIDAAATTHGPQRRPFDEDACRLVEELRPRVASFHFGLPEPALVERVRRAGCVVIASATSVPEARWLEAHGCDAIIAQGTEAGGHRGMFLETDPAAQPGTFALLPMVVDAVAVPVIAAGGIADGRGIAAALTLGAAAVQLGTAYLLATESLISPVHRQALSEAGSRPTLLTNLFSGRPARGLENRLIRELGPLCADAPPFPHAAAALAPLRAAAEAGGSGDFSPLWAGQAAALARAEPAAEITRRLASQARAALAAGAARG